MQKTIKMSDIAKAAGVSPMTVSRAFRSDASVSAETRTRVLQIAEELGYVFDARASNLRSKKSGFVAVMVPTISNPCFAETVNALSAVVADAGMQVLLGYDDYVAGEEEQRVEQLLSRRPDAIVLTGGDHSARTRRMLRSASIPVIETWDLPSEPIQHVVGFSNAAVMEPLVDHLVARGARRIAFIGGDPGVDIRGGQRRQGFLRAMERHGLAADLLMPVGGPSSVKSGAEAMSALLDGTARFDAVISVFDHAALGAQAECHRRGVRVPDDVMIAGFGAVDTAMLAAPGITTVDPLSAEIGRRAGDLVNDLLGQGAGNAGAVRIEIEPVLRIGGSTG